MKPAILLILLTLHLSCRHSDRTMSFYYWRTTYALHPIESATIRDNHVPVLYIRYFDVDQPPGQTQPSPVSPITFNAPLPAIRIIPVIFIRNRVFEKIANTDPANADSVNTDQANTNSANASPDSVSRNNIVSLAQNILKLSTDISASQHQHPDTIQFDCDWTEKTKTAFFSFLDQYRRISGQSITCTIRLHQVKYPGRTGIPPVDKGILMYYNIGTIDAGNGNSIYTPATAARYIPSLPTYPLNLDIALPIFTWGLHIRDRKVIGLLNKMNFQHFENDTNFTRANDGRFRAMTAGFNGGYYFKPGDLVKIEHVDAATLENIAADIRKYTNHRLHNIIFYDLDVANLRLYDKKDFQKVLDRFD